MNENEPVPVEFAWNAMRALAHELSEMHAEPFTRCFFEEHREVIEHVIDRMVHGDDGGRQPYRTLLGG